MNIGTNKPGTKLTRPVAGWKRALWFIAGVLGLLAALGSLLGGGGWATLIPLVIGAGGLLAAAEKYETIG
ncbi:MAG: hypothetical protein P1U65_15810 [Minwuia sp.]|nr:hypothetical protein [Minwuia sp.]